MNIIYVQFTDQTNTVVCAVFGSPQDPDAWPNLGEIQDDDPRYLAFMNPPPSDADLAYNARQQREELLRNTYDPGIMMALRALRIAATPEQTAYAQGKVSELDAYAEALLAITDQPGFPQTIIWPTAPTK